MDDRMSATRELLVEQLRPALEPDAYLVDYADGIDPPSKPAVMVRLDSVAPHPDVASARRYAYGLVVITPRVDAGPADDQLEAALEVVLDAIRSADRIQWTTAERGVYAANPDAPGYPCVVVSVHVDIVPERRP